MGDQNPGGLNERYRDCLRGDHDHNSPSTKTTHTNRIRDRVNRSVVDGSLLWYSLPQKDREAIFNPVDALEVGMDTTQKFDPAEIEEVRKLRRGVVGWLALLYAGSHEAKNFIDSGKRKYTVTEEWEAKVVPNIHFDFEAMLKEAIQKAENRFGRQVTEYGSFDIETEPIPESPWEEMDKQELVRRFESRDPALTTRELAYLEIEGEIDAGMREEYRKSVLESMNGSNSFKGNERLKEIVEDSERAKDE